MYEKRKSCFFQDGGKRLKTFKLSITAFKTYKSSWKTCKMNLYNVFTYLKPLEDYPPLLPSGFFSLWRRPSSPSSRARAVLVQWKGPSLWDRGFSAHWPFEITDYRTRIVWKYGSFSTASGKTDATSVCGWLLDPSLNSH